MSVLHIQYPEWPNHGVPKDTTAVREILKRIYHVPPNLGPVVVHCRFSSSAHVYASKYAMMMLCKSFVHLSETLSLTVQALGEQEHIAQFITQFREP